MLGTRRVGIVTEPGRIAIETLPMEPLAADTARVRIDMNGICGTDVHYFHDPEIVAARAPLVLGHEWVGTLVEIGSDFPRHDMYGDTLSEGDRIVALYWMCGQCYACKVLQQPSLCMGAPAGEGGSPLPRLQGGIGDYLQIPARSVIAKIPDDMDNETAVLTDPLAVSLQAIERAYSAGSENRRTGIGLGKTVLVQGSGPIGICAVIGAKLSGAARIIVIGAPDGRLALCRDLGADDTINIETVTDPAERREIVLEQTPHHLGPDVVIETAGVPAAFEEGVALVRRGGVMVEVGHFSPRGTATVDPYVLCQKHIHLFGSWVYTYGLWEETCSLLRATHKSFPYSRLVTHHFSLEQSQAALDTARAQQCMKAVVEPFASES